MKRYTQRDKDLHEALAQANAEAAREAAGVAVLPLERNAYDDIDNTVSSSTRARVAARPRQQQPRAQRVRVKWWKTSEPSSSTSHNNNVQQENKNEEHVEDSPISSAPRRHAIDISKDTDSEVEEGEVRSISASWHQHQHQISALLTS